MSISRTIKPLIFVLSCLVLFPCVQAGAQENYPVPPGSPEDWGVPGRAQELPLERHSSSAPADLTTAPRQQENAAKNEPDVPWGDPEEEYTGTKDFGGMAGTGINRYGTTSR
jgi:hypothetical protein